MTHGKCYMTWYEICYDTSCDIRHDMIYNMIWYDIILYDIELCD